MFLWYIWCIFDLFLMRFLTSNVLASILVGKCVVVRGFASLTTEKPRLIFNLISTQCENDFFPLGGRMDSESFTFQGSVWLTSRFGWRPQLYIIIVTVGGRIVTEDCQDNLISGKNIRKNYFSFVLRLVESKLSKFHSKVGAN